ncbi:MAG: hypothetical protein K0U40_00110 [Betaproteobacteria bacterium]|nr:hypothetical protein [Betaproteobacteria bacterium]
MLRIHLFKASDVIIDTDGYAGTNEANAISFTPTVISPTEVAEIPLSFF